MDVMVDDCRDSTNNIIIRRGDVAIELLPVIHERFFIDSLSMDHDLGDKITGYDVLKEVVEIKRVFPKEIYLITSNPVGRENMGRLLEANGYLKKNPSAFIKKEKKWMKEL